MTPTEPRLLDSWRRLIVEVVAVLAVFSAAGLGAGWLWQKLWTPNTGVVVDHDYYPGTRINGNFLATDYRAMRRDFDAVALYVVIGVLAALVLGVLCSLVFKRAAVVTLVAVIAGAALGSLIAYRFGTHLGPPDPERLAATAKNGTTLSSDLVIKGKSSFVAWPLGALVGLMVTYFLTSGVSEAKRRDIEDPTWMQRPDCPD